MSEKLMRFHRLAYLVCIGLPILIGIVIINLLIDTSILSRLKLSAGISIVSIVILYSDYYTYHRYTIFGDMEVSWFDMLVLSTFQVRSLFALYYDVIRRILQKFIELEPSDTIYYWVLKPYHPKVVETLSQRAMNNQLRQQSINQARDDMSRHHRF